MSKHEAEGVIKYELVFREQPLPDAVNVEPLELWRFPLFNLQLIGQSQGRYDGLGYGNLSLRWPPLASSFLISGSQTGHLRRLERSDYAWVRDWDIAANRILAEGQTRPSSESLSHALLYELNDAIAAVVHVHSPEIWCQASALGLAATPSDCAYGTPELAASIRALYRQGRLRDNPLFVMQGHEDGVIAFGPSLEAAVMVLLSTHARALTLS